MKTKITQRSTVMSTKINHAARMFGLAVASVAVGTGTVLAQDAGLPPLPVCEAVQGTVHITPSGMGLIIETDDPNSIIVCDHFNLAQGQWVWFDMNPFARVLTNIGGGMTIFGGDLYSPNGHVILANPNGIMFATTSVLNVAKITAAAGSLTNESEFMNGSANLNFDLNPDAEVANYGKIGDIEGQEIDGNVVDLVATQAVHLLAGRVANHGDINAEGGVVSFVSAEQVTLMEVDPNSHTMVVIDNPGSGLREGAGVFNNGNVRAGSVFLGSGDIYALAIRNDGALHATDNLVFDGETAIGSDVGDVTAGGTMVFHDDVMFDGDSVQGLEATEIQFAGDVNKMEGTGWLGLDADTLNFNGEGTQIASADRLAIGADMKKTSDGSLVLRADEIKFDGRTAFTSNGSLVFDGETTLNRNGEQILAANGAGAELQFSGSAVKFFGDLVLLAASVNFNSADGSDQQVLVFDGLLDVDGSIKKSSAGDLSLGAADGIEYSGDFAFTSDGSLVFQSDVLFDGVGEQIVAVSGAGSELQFANSAMKIDGDLTVFAENVNFNNADGDDQSLYVADGMLDIDGNVKKSTAGDLSLGADGYTFLGGDSIAALGGNLILTGDTMLDGSGGQTLASTGDVQFGGNVDKVDGDLAILGNSVVFSGEGGQQVTVDGGMLEITGDVKKNTDGDLTMGATDGVDIQGNVATTNGGLTFLDDLTLDGDVLVNNGDFMLDGNLVLAGDVEVNVINGGADFGGTIDSTAGDAHGLDVYTDGEDMFFRGDIGMADGGRLGHFRTHAIFDQATGQGLVVFVPMGGGTFSIVADEVMLNDDLPFVPTLATIIVDGFFGESGGSGLSNLNIVTDSFMMGQNQKMTVLGTLNLDVNGTAKLGDISTDGDMFVTAQNIVLLAREAGLVETPDGLVMDLGLGFFANGQFFFNGPITVNGGSPQDVSFISTNPVADGTGTGLAAYRQYLAPAAPLKTGSPPVYGVGFADSNSVSNANNATSFAQSWPNEIPSAEEYTLAGTSMQSMLLERFSIAARPATAMETYLYGTGLGVFNDADTSGLDPSLIEHQVVVNRLDDETVKECIDAYDEVFPDKATKDAVQGEIAAAWSEYQDTAGFDAPVMGFVGHLKAAGNDATLGHLRQIRGVVGGLKQIGLSRSELRTPVRRMVGDELAAGADTPDAVLEMLESLPEA